MEERLYSLELVHAAAQVNQVERDIRTKVSLLQRLKVSYFNSSLKAECRRLRKAATHEAYISICSAVRSSIRIIRCVCGSICC